MSHFTDQCAAMGVDLLNWARELTELPRDWDGKVRVHRGDSAYMIKQYETRLAEAKLKDKEKEPDK